MNYRIALAIVSWALSGAVAWGDDVGKWTNVTPEGMVVKGKDNTGIHDVLADPAHADTLYAFTCRDGAWKSTDFGQTWKKASTQNGPLDLGKNWGSAIAPDGSYILSTSSASRSIFKSTDGGVTWTASSPTTILPYNVEIDPADKNHAIAAGHDEINLIESRDAGQTWTDQGPMGDVTVSSYVHFLLDGNTVLAVSFEQPEKGTWRGVKQADKWTWTRVSSQDHDHGSHQILVDRQRKLIYNPGPAPGLGIQLSADNGLTWSSVSKIAADAIVATPSTLYACQSYPIQGKFDPHWQHAPRDPADARWIADPTPDDMLNGAKRIAVTNDGKHSILVGGNFCGGIWRYVEPAPASSSAGAAPNP